MSRQNLGASCTNLQAHYAPNLLILIHGRVPKDTRVRKCHTAVTPMSEAAG
ncbi:MAG: hypothetical protein IT327_21135 [Anaerolineae bacterium]|nr:hypothetical protein [Anaerolineae bacterium]